MKDEDIKLPSSFASISPFAGPRIEEEIKRYAREAVRLNIDPRMKQRSDAWYEVVKALDEACPGWMEGKRIAVDAAVNAIKRMADQGKDKQDHQEPRPFDLEAAKRGEPIVTRDGRKARFVAHVPEAGEDYRVLAIVEGDQYSLSYLEDGRHVRKEGKHHRGLFMDPKPKRVVWLNLYEDLTGYVWPSKERADYSARHANRDYKEVAIRVELD